ncbi:hypothetical protein NQZ79_g1105 [Umbelopsis isabellina]|nr:hypothetical protein NQZ79_g1105 [Umbelopsis isabellina]
MEHIDRNRLYTDSDYRFEYVSKFVEFGAEDIEAIKSVADKVKPLVPVVVDAVYAKLFTFDITKKHFLKKNEGFSGPVFRKDFLSKYLNRLLNGPYDVKMLKYLDWVAKIHTDTPEKKSKISVDYIHVNALMGYVESTLVGGLLSLNLDRETESKALLAFNKLLWIQNDFFAKYYCKDGITESVVNASSTCVALKDKSGLALAALAGALAVWLYTKKLN